MISMRLRAKQCFENPGQYGIQLAGDNHHRAFYVFSVFTQFAIGVASE